MDPQEIIQICGRDWPGEKILDRANEALSILHDQIVKYDDEVDKINIVTEKLLRAKIRTTPPRNRGKRMTRILSKYASKSLRDRPFLRSHELRGATLEQNRDNALNQKEIDVYVRVGFRNRHIRQLFDANVREVTNIGRTREGDVVGRLRELQNRTENFIEGHLQKRIKLERCRYSSRPFLCSKKWCSPVERVRHRHQPCLKCEILAMERRKIIRDCPNCKSAADMKNNQLMEDFLAQVREPGLTRLQDRVIWGLLRSFLGTRDWGRIKLAVKGPVMS